jgi:hypothetical protein
MKPLTSRTTAIIGTYHLSTDLERSNGKNWYRQAHRAALDLSGPFACGVITSAGVISALSPNNKWERNLRDAQTLFDRFKVLGADAASQVKVSTYGANKAKALTILKLQSPTVDDVAAVLNGLKSIAFYRCILGDSQAVCVDGHAFSIWAGEHITTPKTPKISPRLYDQIADDYRAAARIVSTPSQPVNPSELQAITWLTHKRLNGR